MPSNWTCAFVCFCFSCVEPALYQAQQRSETVNDPLEEVWTHCHHTIKQKTARFYTTNAHHTHTHMYNVDERQHTWFAYGPVAAVPQTKVECSAGFSSSEQKIGVLFSLSLVAVNSDISIYDHIWAEMESVIGTRRITIHRKSFPFSDFLHCRERFGGDITTIDQMRCGWK